MGFFYDLAAQRAAQQAAVDATKHDPIAGLKPLTNVFGQPLTGPQLEAAKAANAAIISGYANTQGFSNPVDWFSSVGDNRNLLYGAYGTIAPDYSGTGVDGNLSPSEGGIDPNYDPWSQAMSQGVGSFWNRSTPPDLSQYQGDSFIMQSGEFEDEIAMKASQEAQQIIKQFYPNISQSQMDQAAYAAMQKMPAVPYWGAGPIPTVQAIAAKLGGTTPELGTWIAQNQEPFAKRYQGYRENIHSMEDADSLSRTMGDIKGLASVLGPVVGGLTGLTDLVGSGLNGLFGEATPAINAAASGTGAAAGPGGTSMFEGLGDWFSNLFGGSTGGATDFIPAIANSADPIEGLWQAMNATGATTATEAANALGFGTIESMLGSINPSWISTGLSNPTSTAAKLLKAIGATGADGSVNPTVISGLLSAGGGILSGNAATGAAETAANAQLEAARIAADAAKFKPVGVTTRFGQSNFTKDAQGNVTNAGYTMPADIKAMQDSLIGAAPGMLGQFTGSQAATAPMGDAAQRMMTLGNQYLAADPQAQAKLFYDQQQQIMATERARQEAGTLAGEFNRGTYGLATGGTGMMGAANPRMEALYNAQRQQDLQASYDATKGGQQYAQFGSGMVGAGGDMLKSMYGTQVASLDPWKAAMGGAQTIEGLGQNALDLSVNMGKVASPAQSGQLLAQGMLGAANTMQPANAYSPWGTALMNAGNALSSMSQPQQQNQQYMFNPFTGVRL